LTEIGSHGAKAARKSPESITAASLRPWLGDGVAAASDAKMLKTHPLIRKKGASDLRGRW